MEKSSSFLDQLNIQTSKKEFLSFEEMCNWAKETINVDNLDHFKRFINEHPGYHYRFYVSGLVLGPGLYTYIENRLTLTIEAADGHHSESSSMALESLQACYWLFVVYE